MTEPLRIACLGIDTGAIAGDPGDAPPFAAFVATGFDALAVADADALLIGVDDLSRVAAWPALEAVALQAAVVVVVARFDAALAQRLVEVGVQDVLAADDTAAAPARMARALRLAVARKRLEVATRRAYATDLATGLPNHPQLLEHMTHLVALREREPAPMALIALRVRGLEATAAALGAESANVLRRKVAVRLRSGLRASDVVASIGVDAFAVLLAWIDAPTDGQRVAEKLAVSLLRPFTVAGQAQSLQVGVGLANYPAHGKDAEALLRRALAQAAQLGTDGSAPVDRTPGATGELDRGADTAANDA